MGRLGLAFSLFFKALGNAEFAESARQWLDQGPPRLEAPTAQKTQPEPARPEPKPERPVRSEAVALLAALQREARLVDFLMEDLSGYDDAQVGAAARDVQTSGQRVLQRMLQVAPLREEAEGATVEVPADFDAGLIQLVGQVGGEPPLHGALNHHGWVARAVKLPKWQGSREAAAIIAPAEVEIR